MRVMSAPSYCATQTRVLCQEAEESTPGLRRMLEEEPDKWAPVFKEVIEQTKMGAEQTLDGIQELPAQRQARETLYTFLEGGLVAGVFEGLASASLRALDADLDQRMGEARQKAHSAAAQGDSALEEFALGLEDSAEHSCENLDEVDSVEGFRQAMTDIFIQGYTLGTARALQKDP